MPRNARPAKEIDAFKEHILDSALEIMAEHGLQGLTMRRLADRIGTTATAIYRYYSGKDEIFLRVRERGFNIAYREALLVGSRYRDPLKRLRAVTRAVKEFAVKESHHYKIMLTWDVPMYPDFKGTTLEPVAFDVLQASTRLVEMYTGLMEEIGTKYGLFPKSQARLQFLFWLTELHGIVSLYGNSAIQSLHDNPDRLLDTLIERLLSHWRATSKEDQLNSRKTGRKPSLKKIP